MPITPLSRAADLSLSKRANNTLQADNIIYVGDLVQKTRADLLRAPMTGPVTVAEIETALSRHCLSLGTFDPSWPPASIEAALAA